MKDEGNTGVEKELIPLHDITPEARMIAVAWIENYQPMGFDIQQKHKLASDIMNYSNQQNAELRQSLSELTDAVKVYILHWDKFFGEPKVGQPPSLEELRKLVDKSAIERAKLLTP